MENEIINVHAAKTHFSKLLEKVANGEKVVIGKAGKPIAILQPYAQATKSAKKKRAFGQFKGQIWVSPDFDDEDPEILRMFGMLDE